MKRITPPRRRADRRGFTMIELMVCIGIIGLLLALILPAVQQSREAARRITCSNRLRQLSLAMHSVHEAHTHFPGPSDHMFFQLMDHMELQSERKRLEEEYLAHGTYHPGLVQVRAFACPSNHVRLAAFEHSYVRNRGVLWRDPFHVFPCASDPSDGMDRYEYGTNRRVTLGHVTDGTSNTALFSETKPWNVDAGSRHPVDRSRMYFRKAEREPTDYEDLSAMCRMARQPAKFYGDTHHFTSRGCATYTHVGPPNQPPCFWDPEIEFQIRGRDSKASQPPSSAHTGGVFVAFVDGSVRFVANQIDQQTWMALGSRNGGEVAPSK